VAVHKVQNVERLVNEQEADLTGKERISMLSVFGTLISVVFVLPYVVAAACLNVVRTVGYGL
jgi:hypothetical protein